MSESPRTEVRHISHLGNNHQAVTRKVETIHENVIDTLEWDVPGSAVPNYLRYKIDNRNNLGTGRHHERTTNTPGIELVALDSYVLDEERGNQLRRLDCSRHYTGGGDVGL